MNYNDIGLKGDEYIKYGEIQSFINEHFIKNNIKIGVQESVSFLFKNSIYHSDIPKLPNFKNWDLTDINEFNKLFFDTPVYLKYILPDYFKPSSEVQNFEELNENRDVYLFRYFNNLEIRLYKKTFYEINYVISGSCKLILSDGEYTINQGEFCFVPPHVSHDLLVDENNNVISFSILKSTFHETFFNMLDQNDLLSDFFRTTLYGKNTKINCLFFAIKDTEEVNNIIRSLCQESFNYTLYSNEICISLINILFSIILRDYNNSIENLFTLDNNSSENANFSLILQYIYSNYKTVTLNSLSDIFHFDESYLGKIIKKNSGMNFSDLIKNIRLKNATSLLKNKKYKVSDIAELVGYNSTDHFSKTFKTKYGYSPKQFQEKVK